MFLREVLCTLTLYIGVCVAGPPHPYQQDEIFIPPSPYDPYCTLDMWTKWFDVDDAEDEGDFETLFKIQRTCPESVCQEPINIQARVVGSNTLISALDFYLRIEMNPKVGLICKNVGQSCQNFEVRFCCPKVPDCTGGEWTPYINADAPGGNGDFETLWNARLVDPSICTNPIAADARLAKECIHWSVLGRGEVTNNGFVCKNTDYYHIPYLPDDVYSEQDGSYGPTADDYSFYYQCDDYEVRFCCPKVPTPQCGPLDWTPWLNSDKPTSDSCDIETLPRLWQKYQDVVCKYPTAIDVRSAASGVRYHPALNIEVNLYDGFKCCNRFGETCDDYEVRFCCPDEYYEPYNPSCYNGEWTRYFDIDDPTEVGDFEKFGALREVFAEYICAHPTAVDARAVGTDSHYPIRGQVATLTSEEGFSCRNSQQNFGKCLDYEVRFCCPEEPIIIIDPCDNNPCENDGECTAINEDNVYCNCTEEFSGQYCELTAPDDCSYSANASYYVPIPFYSPAYPYDYFNNLYCYWLISAPNDGDHIQLDFIDFNLESGYDFLAVHNGYRGEVLLNLTGRLDPFSFIVSNYVLTVVLHTDTYVVRTGFLATYLALKNYCLYYGNPCQNFGTCTTLLGGGYECNCTEGYVGVNCTEFLEIDLCDDNPCENDEECTVLDDETVYCDCSEQFSGQFCELEAPDDCAVSLLANPDIALTFDSPAYPYDYFNNLDCYWSIVAPNATDLIQLDFIDFNLEEDFDFVTVHEGFFGEVLLNVTGMLDPFSYLAPYYEITVTFNTDGSVVKTGFAATYRALRDFCFIYRNPCQNDGTCTIVVGGSYECNCNGGYFGTNCTEIDLCDDNPCENDEECSVLDDGTVYCDCTEQFSGQFCELEAPDDCDVSVLASSGAALPLYSPAYPYDYFNNLDCYWSIEAPNSSYLIQLDFIDFYLEEDFDFLAVFSESANVVLLNLTGKLDPFSYIAHDFDITVIINTDGSIVETGFFATYRAVRDYCLTYGNPCQNDGTCTTAVGGSYECICTGGFIGANCTDIQGEFPE